MAKKNGNTSKTTTGKKTAAPAKKPKFREVTFLATAKVPEHVTDGKALQLVRRLVDIGFEDAANAPDDWSDKDKPVVDVMTVKVKPAK